MVQLVLGLINYGVVLLFGITISASFLGLLKDRKSIINLLIFSIVAVCVQGVLFGFFGLDTTTKLYPFAIHLPLGVYLSLVFKKKPLSVCFSILTAYLCCQLAKWIYVLALELSVARWCAYIIHSLTLLVLAVLIIRFISNSITELLSGTLMETIILSILPVAYYVFDYITTIYTKLLYTGSSAAIEFMPFLLSFIYIIYSVVYYRLREDKLKSDRERNLFKIKSEQSAREIENIKHSEYQISMVKHDMRHHINELRILVQSGEDEKAIEYMDKLSPTIEDINIHRICANYIVNTVISYYKSIAKEQGVEMEVSVKIHEKIPVPDVELASMLSNGLENAIKAVAILKEEEKIIHLNIHNNHNRTLISIENPYAHEVILKDGVPVSKESGHGIGTQSIKYNVEKNGGKCMYQAAKGWFALRIVI